MLFFLIF